MRIGLVSPYSFDVAGGVQNQVLGLANWLRTRGHQVKVFGPGRHPEATSAGAAVPVRFNSSTARIRLLPSSSKLRAWAQDLDLIHVHEPFVPLIGPAATRLGLPLVVTFHAAINPRWAKAAQRLRPIRPAAVIAVSEVAAKVPRALGLEPQIIPNAIDWPAIPPRQSNGFQLTFVGRFDEPRKGFETLVAALPTLRARHPQLQVQVVGTGRRKVPGVRFLGALTDEDRDRALAQTDVFVAPQLGAESFGIVLLEALAAGARVVASDLPAFRGVASDAQGPLARFFAPGDAGGLADQVSACFAEPVASPERVRAHLSGFHWDRIGTKIESLYAALPAIA